MVNLGPDEVFRVLKLGSRLVGVHGVRVFGDLGREVEPLRVADQDMPLDLNRAVIRHRRQCLVWQATGGSSGGPDAGTPILREGLKDVNGHRIVQRDAGPDQGMGVIRQTSENSFIGSRLR